MSETIQYKYDGGCKTENVNGSKYHDVGAHLTLDECTKRCNSSETSAKLLGDVRSFEYGGKDINFQCRCWRALCEYDPKDWNTTSAVYYNGPWKNVKAIKARSSLMIILL